MTIDRTWRIIDYLFDLPAGDEEAVECVLIGESVE